MIRIKKPLYKGAVILVTPLEELIGFHNTNINCDALVRLRQRVSAESPLFSFARINLFLYVQYSFK